MNQQLKVEQAYKIISAVTEALDYVAANPEKAPQLAIELIMKSPKIYEALLALTPVEHHPLIHDLFKSALNLAKSLSKHKGENP